MSNKKMAVFFPGLGYHTDKPLLYYSRNLCMQLGFDECINLKYDYDGQKVFKDKSKIQEAVEELLEQTRIQLKNVDFSDYDEIVFVSKSVGTAVAARFALEKSIKCKNIYMTPLKQTFIEGLNAGIAFTGTSDQWVDIEVIKEGSIKYNIPLTIYDGANHSLETNDVNKNIQVLIDVINKSLSYLS